MIKLGQLVKDCVTDFAGIAVGRTEWMNGCIQIGVKPQELKDGKPQDAQWIDYQQLIVVGEGVIPMLEIVKDLGGPSMDVHPTIQTR